MKRITVIGATGDTGKEVVSMALKLGFSVTVVVRKPASIPPDTNLSVMYGDVMIAESLLMPLRKADVVISCFGPQDNFKPEQLMSIGTKNLIAACESSNVKKLIFMSGILQSNGRELSFFNRLGQQLLKMFYKKVVQEKKLAENMVMNSRQNWTILRAVGLKKMQPTGTFEAGELLGVSPFRPLSYTDFAACLLQAVDRTHWNKKIIHAGAKK